MTSNSGEILDRAGAAVQTATRGHLAIQLTSRLLHQDRVFEGPSLGGDIGREHATELLRNSINHDFAGDFESGRPGEVETHGRGNRSMMPESESGNGHYNDQYHQNDCSFVHAKRVSRSAWVGDMLMIELYGVADRKSRDWCLVFMECRRLRKENQNPNKSGDSNFGLSSPASASSPNRLPERATDSVLAARLGKGEVSVLTSSTTRLTGEPKPVDEERGWIYDLCLTYRQLRTHECRHQNRDF